MYEDIRRSAEEYFRQGYSISSIRTTIEQHIGPKVAEKVIRQMIEEKSAPLIPYVKDLRGQGYTDEQIHSAFVGRGYDPDIVDGSLSKRQIEFPVKKTVLILVPILVVLLIAFFTIGGTPESDFSGTTDADVDASLSASLVDTSIEPGSDLWLDLEAIVPGQDRATVTIVIRDDAGFFIEEYDIDLITEMSSEEVISLPGLAEGTYSLGVSIDGYDASEDLTFTIEEPDTEDMDDDQPETIDEDDEHPDTDDTPPDIDDTPDLPADIDEDIEEDVANMLGGAPTNILTEDQIYFNARLMPLQMAIEYCSDFPDEIAEECIRQAEAAADVDMDDCEIVQKFGMEVCVSEYEEEELKDSYCDYITHDASRETCEMISQQYDGIIELIQDSDMGLGFSLVVFSDGDHIQTDFAELDEIEDDSEDESSEEEGEE